MKRFITLPRGKRGIRLWAVAFWLIVWHAAALLLGEELLLPSPLSVLRRFAELLTQADFYSRCLFSCARILSGFVLGALLGMLIGALAAGSRFLRDLLAPLVSVIRAIPVASFIILALVWLDAKALSGFIALLITFPVFYSNVMTGILSADRQLLEMAAVFELGFVKRVRAVYLPALAPYLSAAVEVAVGLAWKSGIAAEVIAIPKGSIGEKLYYAKIYLLSGDMLCWTLGVVLLSGLTGRAIRYAVARWCNTLV